MNKIKNTVKVILIAIICTVAVYGCSAKGVKMPTAVDQAVALIADFEGFRSHVYTCPGGKKTIGYGFTDAELTPTMLEERISQIPRC